MMQQMRHVLFTSLSLSFFVSLSVFATVLVFWITSGQIYLLPAFEDDS